MILSQISYVDCLVFLIFLVPQLLLSVGLVDLLQCLVQALPYICLRMPYELFKERSLAKKDQSPFVQQATWFQDIVIRCVRFAFARIDAKIGAVFFSKGVALPFFYFRMLRHGYLRCPVHWEEIPTSSMKGLYFIADKTKPPDVIVYYSHGGGFSMGSSFFYTEFLIAWVHLLRISTKATNPALFALEYSLVPTQTYPTQLHETLAGYHWVLSRLPPHLDSSRVCLAGDSAGATLMLSLLLTLAEDERKPQMPGFATLISPWCVLVSPKNRDTASDYLNAESLHLYAKQYVGDPAALTKAGAPKSKTKGRWVSPHHPRASPGDCDDLKLWRKACPEFGFHFVYGAEEVFAPETAAMIGRIKRAIAQSSADGDKKKPGIWVSEEKAGIHAWPVVALFLASSREERTKGLKAIVDRIGKAIDL